MSVFLIADAKVTDDAWIPEYPSKVHDIVAKHGGKYLSRSGNIDTIEGDVLDTTLIALIQVPSGEALDAFASDPEDAPFGKARQGSKAGRQREPFSRHRWHRSCRRDPLSSRSGLRGVFQGT